MSDALADELVFLLDGEVEGSERSPRSLRELAGRIAALRKPKGLRASFRRGRRARLVYRTPDRLIRGSVKVPLRVVRRTARRR